MTPRTRRNIMTIAALAVVISVAAIHVLRPSPPIEERALVGSDISDLVTGREADGENADGLRFNIWFAADGRLEAAIDPTYASLKPGALGQAPERDFGRWSVEDDQLCLRWRRWDDGAPVCYSLTRTADGFRSYRDGKFISQFTLAGD